MINLKEISLDNWVKFGEGGSGVSYYNTMDDSIMLKLAKKDSRAIKNMEAEMACIDEAMSLNISTPKMIDKISCNGQIGMIYERIPNKKSLGRLCHDNPENIKEYAESFAKETVKFHSIKCDDKNIKDTKKFTIDSLKNGRQDKIYTNKIMKLLVNEVNDTNTLLHGDLTVGNIIFSNDKWYWIDLGKMGYGDPIFDLMDAYFSFNILSQFKFVRDIFHMTKPQLIELWDNFIKEYAYLSNQNLDKLITRIKRLASIYFFNIWVTGRYVPFATRIVHKNAIKYYREFVGE